MLLRIVRALAHIGPLIVHSYELLHFEVRLDFQIISVELYISEVD